MWWGDKRTVPVRDLQTHTADMTLDPAIRSVCFPQHMLSSGLALRIHTLVIWQHTFYTAVLSQGCFSVLRCKVNCQSQLVKMINFDQFGFSFIYPCLGKGYFSTGGQYCVFALIWPPLLFSCHHGSARESNLNLLYSWFWCLFSVFAGQCLIGHLSQRTDWLHYLNCIITLASKGRIGQTEERLGFFPSGPCWQMRWYQCTETGPTGDHGVWGTYGQTGCWWAAYISLS